MAMSLCRDIWPPPQLLLHADHSPQRPHTQSIGAVPGQAAVSQAFVWYKLPLHGFPKFSASVKMSRVLVVCPPLHVWVQADQKSQGRNTQSFGICAIHAFACVLHACISRSPPRQGGPPLAPNCATARFRSRCPLHNAVQALQGAQGSHKQGILAFLSLHGSMLHARNC